MDERLNSLSPNTRDTLHTDRQSSHQQIAGDLNSREVISIRLLKNWNNWESEAAPQMRS